MYNTTHPTLSIIVPVYNVEKLLSKCIESILEQPFNDFELILIDDGSQDRSGQLCDKYAANDSRIRVIHKKNGGISSARNYGLDIAKGKYISFIDSDDYISPDFYDNIEILKNNADIDFVSIPIKYIDNNYKIIQLEKRKKNEIISEKKRLYELWFGANGTVKGYIWQNIYKSHIWSDLRFEGRVYEDCLIQSYILEKVKKVYLSTIGEYIYVKHNGSLTNTSWTIDKIKYDLKATILYFEKCNKYKVDTSIYLRNITQFVSRMFTNAKHYDKEYFIPYYKKIDILLPSIRTIITADISFYSKMKLSACKIFSVKIMSYFSKFL